MCYSATILNHRSGSVNIHQCSPTLRKITVSVNSQAQIVSLLSENEKNSRETEREAIFFCSEVNITYYPKFEWPIRTRVKHYSLVWYFIT